MKLCMKIIRKISKSVLMKNISFYKIKIKRLNVEE